jgi:hypothetical protein
MSPTVLLPVLLLATATACAAVPGPRERLPPADLAVEVSGTALEWADENPFDIEGSEGAVVIRDRAVTGRCHRRENHGAYRDRDEVVFWMAHTGEKGAICQAIAVIFGYEAVVRGLSAGEHTVRVEYIGHVSSDGAPGQPLQARVTVR